MNGDKGRDGLIRKAETLLVIVAAGFLAAAMRLPWDLANAVAVAFSINEGISIAENCAQAGVPIPRPLVDALVRAKQVTGRGRSGDDVKKELGS